VNSCLYIRRNEYYIRKLNEDFKEDNWYNQWLLSSKSKRANYNWVRMQQNGSRNMNTSGMFTHTTKKEWEWDYYRWDKMKRTHGWGEKRGLRHVKQVAAINADSPTTTHTLTPIFPPFSSPL
jgi:hypothetical protein